MGKPVLNSDCTTPYFFTEAAQKCNLYLGPFIPGFHPSPLPHAHREGIALSNELPEESDQFRIMCVA